MAAGLGSSAAPRRSEAALAGAQRQPAAAAHTFSLVNAFPMALTACILAGFALRLLLLDRFPLREDEAIYAFWARYGREVDWRFLQVWPDKPPLFIAALALAFEAWGTAPAAARLLNIVVSVLTIPVVAVTARRWWGPIAGMVAALAMTLSPFAISFAPTVYTDPLLVLAGSLALCAAAFGRPFWAGLWLGAAIMTKQQGLLYAPLVVAVMGLELTQRRKDAKGVLGKVSLTQSRRDAEKRREYADKTPLFFLCEPLRLRASASRFSAPLRTMIFFTIGLLLIVGPVLWWDSLRWAVAPSPWDLGAQNVGALAVLPPAQWPARTAAWLALGWQLQASWPVWLLGGLVLLAATVISARQGPRRADWPAWLLLGWGLALLALHIVTSVQVWDRYLLPLTPVLALLAGWSVAVVGGALVGITPRRQDAKTRPDFLESNLKMAHAKARRREDDSRFIVPQSGMATDLKIVHAKARRREGLSLLLVPQWGMDIFSRFFLRFSASPRLSVRSSDFTGGFFAVLACVAMVLLALPAFAAADGRLPAGADHGDYAGLEDALALITQPIPLPQSPISNLQSPNLPIPQSPPLPAPRTVLYHHNLGWQAQFYLFDALAAGRVDLRWFPSATALADNAAKTPHLRRYLVEADWAPVRDLSLQLAARRLQLEPVLRRDHFTVYAITAEPPADAVDWRVCAPSAPWPVWAGARSEGRGASTSQFTIDHSQFTIARGEGREARSEGRGAPTSQFTIDHSQFTIVRGEGRGAK